MPIDDHSSAVRQLLFFDQRSTCRLLEVYVKRSLSLNDAGGLRKQKLKSRKWVTLTDRGAQARRASSDSSTHRLSIENILKTTESTKAPQSDSLLLSVKLSTRHVERKARRTPEPARKSFLRAVLSWFSKKGSESKVEAPSPQPETLSSELGAEEASKAVKNKHSFKKLSFRSVERSESLKKATLTAEDVVRLPNAVSVEPTSTYFEKVSEELERIVKEVKTSPAGEAAGSHTAADHDAAASEEQKDAVERIISLLKQQGDAMDEKIKRNSSVHSFLQQLSYGSFQQLADRYLSQIPQPIERVTQTAPELVQLAFTLDFTAKVAGLSNHAVSRIMGFGNQYLQDRFTQICSAHKQVAEDVEGHCCSDPE